MVAVRGLQLKVAFLRKMQIEDGDKLLQEVSQALLERRNMQIIAGPTLKSN